MGTPTCQKLDSKLSKQLVDDVDNFLFDCDGVLWDGHGAISGSLECISYLKKIGKKIYYVTNNSTSTRAEYAEKCQKFGFDATEEEIVCTAFVGALFLKDMHFDGKVYVIGNPAMGKELDKFGIKHIGIGPDQEDIHGLVTDWLKFELDPEVNCVLVGFDKYLSLPKLIKASSYIQREGCLFLGTNEDSHLPVGGNIVIPGTGTMIHAVKTPSRREPVILGKPERSMFDFLQQAHNLVPDKCCMVGDRIETDIGMAKVCGLKSLLVFSGVSKLDDVLPKTTKCTPEQLPDFCVDCLGDVHKLLED